MGHLPLVLAGARSTVSSGQWLDLRHGHWSLEKLTEGNILELEDLKYLEQEK